MYIYIYIFVYLFIYYIILHHIVSYRIILYCTDRWPEASVGPVARAAGAAAAGLGLAVTPRAAACDVMIHAICYMLYVIHVYIYIYTHMCVYIYICNSIMIFDI